MNVTESVSLKPLNTFRIGGLASYFVEVKTEDEIFSAVAWAQEKNVPFFVLGFGSNILVSDSGFDGLVIKMGIEVIEFKDLDDEHILATVGAGVIWDDFVKTAIENGAYGLENLSFVPGTVGASPVQNIGCYGVEVSTFIESVEAYDANRREKIILSKSECEFDYRNSIFKRNKNLIVVKVNFKLLKKFIPNFSYKNIESYFIDNKENVASELMREAVKDIRYRKLPDWREVGTAGSFYANPIIDKNQFDELIKKYPEMVYWDLPDGRVKIPGGWLVEFVAKYKGKRVGGVGSFFKQALALVNFGGATSKDVMNFSDEIVDIVKRETGIELEMEVQAVGNIK